MVSRLIAAEERETICMARKAVSKSGPLDFLTGIGRAFGGAVLFAFPLMMTMEMWQLGHSLNRLRLTLFIAVTLPLLFGLSYYSGFEKTESRAEDAEDAFVAFGVGFVASALLLVLFGIITFDMPLGEVVGKIAIQTVPASIGAIVASKQFHSRGGSEEGDDEEDEKPPCYPAELFLMAAGALFVAFNVAPTEEMLVITFSMTVWHAVALALLTLAMLHALVYTVGFAGQEERPDNTGFMLTFLHFTLAGYGVSILVSLYVLWTFERLTGAASGEIATMLIVMALPASLGAATARLIV